MLQNVSGPLLGEVMILWASLPSQEWGDFDRRLERVVEVVRKKNDGENSLMLAMAVVGDLRSVSRQNPQRIER